MKIENAVLITSGEMRVGKNKCFITEKGIEAFLERCNSVGVLGEYGQQRVNEAICNAVGVEKYDAMETVVPESAVVRYTNARHEDGKLIADITFLNEAIANSYLNGTVAPMFRAFTLDEYRGGVKEQTLTRLVTFDICAFAEETSWSTDSVSIKLVVSKDADQIAAFLKPLTDAVFQYYPEGYTWFHNVFLSKLVNPPLSPAERRRVLIAIDKETNTLVGMSLFKEIETHKAKLCSFYTIPKTHCGDVLMKASLGLWSTKTPLRITVPEEVFERMSKLLESHGFAYIGIANHPYREGKDEHVYCKPPCNEEG